MGTDLLTGRSQKMLEDEVSILKTEEMLRYAREALQAAEDIHRTLDDLHDRYPRVQEVKSTLSWAKRHLESKESTVRVYEANVRAAYERIRKALHPEEEADASGT